MQHGQRPLEIANRQRRARPRRGDIQSLLDHILEAEGEARGCSVAFVGERTIRRLHRDWIGRNSVTDVVSFPLGDPPPGADPDDASIGEVVVCVPVCQESSRARGLPLHEEVARVLIHGTLHLLGYDHALPDQRSEMKLRQRRYLAWYRRSGLEVMQTRCSTQHPT
jgi:probable rRNA maturation factor